MRKILIGLLSLVLIPGICLAGTVSRHTTYTTNSSVTATNLNGNFDNIVTEVNGGLDNTNIKAGANIAGSKLGTLATIVSGAGKIPIANIDTGTTANKIVVLDSSAKLPAVDGSALTGLVGFGAWVDKSASYAAQQAATDGFVIASASDTGDNGAIYGYTDVNTNPTTLRCQHRQVSLTGARTAYYSFTMPVKKNDYWKIELTTWTIISVYWIPLGS